jgi:hypothetical protein
MTERDERGTHKLQAAQTRETLTLSLSLSLTHTHTHTHTTHTHIIDP